MEAEHVSELPEGEGWQYEPKWDGFRGILENDGGELALWSRKERPLLRYFPELRPLGDLLPAHSALDGEIVIARDGVLDFDSMQTRLHPAESRVRKLSAEIPAEFVVFDLLLWKGKPVHERPLEKRRAELERVADGFRLSPYTHDAEAAQDWLDTFEKVGLDGVIAKRLGLPYLPGSREGVVKVKPYKTADCVVVGLRWKSKPERIATILLGLYNDEGEIDYVGTAAVAASKHAQIAERLVPLLEDAPERRFSEPNRWGTGELEQASVRPELVAEVRYDKVQGNRFRHGTEGLHVARDPPAARAGRSAGGAAARLAGRGRGRFSRRCAWRARAAPAWARRASSGSSADRAPRRRLPSPPARPTLAGRAGRRPPRRSPHGRPRARQSVPAPSRA
jgi:ATP-dependent DNA ligase